MTRPRPHLHSRQQTHSLGNPTVYQGVNRERPKDRRPTTLTTNGQQGPATCPVCGTVTGTRKATHSNPPRDPDTPMGTIVIGSHRHGGGTYSAMRGDQLCTGAGTPPEETP